MTDESSPSSSGAQASQNQKQRPGFGVTPAMTWALNSALFVPIAAGTCFVFGTIVYFHVSKGQGLPADLQNPWSAQELVVMGALTLLLAIAYLVVFAMIVAVVGLLLAFAAFLACRFRPDWAVKFHRFKRRGWAFLVSERREELQCWRSGSKVIRRTPVTWTAAFVLTLSLFVYLAAVEIAKDLPQRAQGRPYPSATVTLTDGVLADVLYVRRIDGFFLFLTEDRTSYLMIPEADVRRLSLIPRTSGDKP